MRYLRFVRPWVVDYVDRSRANREYQDQQFRARRDKAIARQAVEEQGVGE